MMMLKADAYCHFGMEHSFDRPDELSVFSLTPSRPLDIRRYGREGRISVTKHEQVRVLVHDLACGETYLTRDE